MIVALDSFPKMMHMLGLSSHSPALISPALILERGHAVCGRTWEDLLSDYPGHQPYRAQRACFASAYMYFLLTDVYGMHQDDTGGFWALDSHMTYDLSWVLGAAAVAVLPDDFAESYSL